MDPSLSSRSDARAGLWSWMPAGLGDVMISRKGESEAAEEIREKLGGSFLPILILASRIDVEYRELAYRKGAIQYTARPFYVNHVIEQIDLFFRSSRRVTQLRHT